jgi:hypothetical protein
MSEQIHLCILSGQALPNLLPLCLHRPQRIALAVSGDMHKSVQPMIATLLKVGLITRAEDVISLPDMPDHDYSAMLAWARQQISLIRQILPDHHLTLNATGGTKLMSQALSIACQEHPEYTSVLYCDTSHDSIEWLAPHIERAPLPDGLLDSASILKANGIERDEALSDDDYWRADVVARAELTRWLAGNAAGGLRGFIPVLNNLLYEVTAEQLPISRSFKQLFSNPVWREALRRLEAEGLLQLAEPISNTETPGIVVKDAHALRYLTGIWLEEYLWLCLRDAGLKDVHCSQKISDHLDSQSDEKLNELDVVVGHRNRVLVIECKTADLTRAGAYNRMLDKLDSLGKRAGGLLTQCWLVAVRWPHHSEAQQNRLRLLARSRNIVLVEPRHLADLPKRISAWKTSLKLPLQ